MHRKLFSKCNSKFLTQIFQKRHQNWVNLKRTVIPPTGSVYHLVCETSQVCKRIISKRRRPNFSISEKTSSFYLHKNDQPKMEQARLPPFASEAPQEAMVENTPEINFMGSATTWPFAFASRDPHKKLIGGLVGDGKLLDLQLDKTS